jgi:quinol monooxygenase YgiN
MILIPWACKGGGHRSLGPVLVVTRYRVPTADQPDFLRQARTAVAALVARPGCTGATVGRAVDEPDLWTLTTTWARVGDYRRALSAHEVKLHAVPLMYRAIDESSAYEELLRWEPGTPVVEHPSEVAADSPAADARPGG